MFVLTGPQPNKDSLIYCCILACEQYMGGETLLHSIVVSTYEHGFIFHAYFQKNKYVFNLFSKKVYVFNLRKQLV